MTTMPERLQDVIAEMRLYEGAYPPKVKVWADRLEAAQAMQVAPEVVQALRDLLRHVEVNTCTHEETHRGGAIWTICDSCDRKWADDRGGFVPHEDVPEVVAARAALESSTLTQQQGGEQEARAFLAAEVSDGHIDMDFVRSKDAIRAISAALRSKQPAASEGVDSEICMRLVQIVEGGGLTWRDSSGNHRLKDTPDWVAFYCATKNAREREASANTSKQAAGEAQSEDMIDPVKIEISIPGELGKTIRFVERKWLYGNDQHHDDAPASARVEAMRTALTEHFTPPRHPADEGMADALRIAEAALADIGDADREPGDDVAWCERRAAQALPAVRAAIKAGTP